MAAPVNEPRIVLGIDYGTTYSGLAWIQADGQQIPSVQDLNVFKNWPARNAQKVPSALSYSKTNSARRCKQWGYSIDDESQVMRWTKLELEPRTTTRELDVLRDLVKDLDLIRALRAGSSDVPRHIAKNEADIIRDFLTNLAREWYSAMKVGRFTLENVPLEIVITHPASWSYEALNKTFHAVNGAFNKKMFKTLTDHSFSFTSEPEACALNTVQDMLLNDRDCLIPGECFVLCDAGGGTVDLVSYRIDSIEPLVLTRVGGVTGRKCGATFIDQAFLEWLQPKVENLDLLPRSYGTGGHYMLMPRGRVLLSHFERLKHAFDGTNGGDIPLPRGTILAANQEDDDSGVISLSDHDLKGMFAKSVQGTVDLISKQVTQVENALEMEVPCQVTNIFLAGGFAESPYLFNEVKKYADSMGHLSVQRAEDCWSGVVKGAVLRGMGIGMDATPKAIPCPRFYGICISQVYHDWKFDRNESTVKDSFHGQELVPQTLIWLIKKGDVILPDRPTVSTFGVRCKYNSKNVEERESVRIIFVATSTENPPSRMSKLAKETKEVYNLDIDTSIIPRTSFQQFDRQKGGRYYVVDVTVKIEVSQSVKVTVRCDGVDLRSYQTRL